MPVAYTNRKGMTYYLNRGTTKTGKARYYFARQPQDDPVEEIPEGYQISESANGVVSLVKARPPRFLPEEIVAVESAVHRHPKAINYRVSVKRDRIEVYERVGPDPVELVAEFSGLLLPGQEERLRAFDARRAQFTPVLRFFLVDAERRRFSAQRMCYLGRVDGWIGVGGVASVEVLAQQLIPKLGTDQFFELY